MELFLIAYKVNKFQTYRQKFDLSYTYMIDKLYIDNQITYLDIGTYYRYNFCNK